MPQAFPQSAQLDRMEQTLAQLHRLNAEVLDRLTRMEERQAAHAGRIDTLETQAHDQAHRIYELEKDRAIALVETQGLKGRWAMLGAATIAVLGAIGAGVAKLAVTLFSSGG